MGRDECISLWTFIENNKATLTNPHFMNPLLEDSPTHHILLPNISKVLRNVSIWKEYFFRWSAVPSMIDPPHAIFSELHDYGVMHRLSHESNEDFADLSDFEIPAMSCREDSWEALYRVERRNRQALQRKLADLGDASGDDIARHTVHKPNQFDDEMTEIFEDVDEISSPTPMFGDRSIEKVDLLAMAALHDKEKETTDDEGGHMRDSDNDDNEVENESSEQKASDLKVPSGELNPGDHADTCEELRLIIQKQKEEIEYLKKHIHQETFNV